MARIAHLSDIHFGGENAAAVKAARVWLDREAPDLIVITGDVTSFGQPGEFRRAADWAGVLAAPVLVTPGNHDTPYLGLFERLTVPFGRYEESFGPAAGLGWSNGALSAVAVNTARGAQWRWNWSKGAIGRRQTERALELLAARPAGALGVFACHHPLVEMTGGPMTGRVRGGEAAARLLCEGKVDLVLTGHIHAPFAMAYPYGDGHAYAVGAGTLSLRERGVPVGFNLIEADAAKVDVTAQAWNGSSFEVWRTWSLPRRGGG
ncbi:MAG: metallophosphoesterase family protein [Caulobacteraceae bacterium]